MGTIWTPATHNATAYSSTLETTATTENVMGATPRCLLLTLTKKKYITVSSPRDDRAVNYTAATKNATAWTAS